MIRSARWRAFLGGFFIFAILLFLTVPSILVVISSFSSTPVLDFPPKGLSLCWYANIVERSDFRQGLLNTAVVGVISTLIALLAGIGGALAIFRASVPGKNLIHAFLLSPLVLPGVLIGVGLLMACSKVGQVGGWGVVVVAHTLMILPFVLRSLLISLENMDTNLEKAAAILGANPLRQFLYVTVPSLKPGIGAGVLFAFVMSVNEFAVSVFVTARRTQTMPVVLFNYTMAYVDPTIAAVSTLYIVMTVLSVWLIDRFGGLAHVLRIEGKHE